MPYQIVLPEKYNQASTRELAEAVAKRKEELGDSLCILGHHYQRDEIIQFADFTGDSLKLSQLAAAQRARYIVFCGVHFMAESAEILTGPEQVVILPHLQAGCAMAEMAEATDVAAAIEEVTQAAGGKVVPITYVNSTARTKAVTARYGGACCTSSNARNVFEWALRSTEQGGAGGEKIFAIPDEHLGRNTAVAMGYDPADCVVYDPALPGGGLTAEALRRSKFILWKGFCYVHQYFKPQQVRLGRRRYPGATVIVHPECPYEVVRLADASGSTEQIIRAVAGGQAGSTWLVGTESNLVNRLARQHPDRTVRVLSDAPSHCFMMGRIDLPHLLWVLDNLAEGRVVNRIEVAVALADRARAALERMLAIKASADVSASGRGAE